MASLGRRFLIIATVAALLAVLLGAFGAHALSAQLSDRLMAVYQTANQYHFYHALGLLGVGLTQRQLPHSTLLAAAGWAMVIGLVLFSGSLYLLSLSGVGALGIITPFGGTAFIAGWGFFAAALWRNAEALSSSR